MHDDDTHSAFAEHVAAAWEADRAGDWIAFMAALDAASDEPEAALFPAMEDVRTMYFALMARCYHRGSLEYRRRYENLLAGGEDPC